MYVDVSVTVTQYGMRSINSKHHVVWNEWVGELFLGGVSTESGEIGDG